MQDNQDKEPSMDEVQSTREYKKNPGEARDFSHPSRPALESTGSLSRGQNDQGVALTTQSHLAQMLKKE